MSFSTKLMTVLGSGLMLLAILMGQRAVSLMPDPSKRYEVASLIGMSNAIDFFARLMILAVAYPYARKKGLFAWVRNEITNWSPTMRKRVKCIITGVAFLFIAFAVQDMVMLIPHDPEGLTTVYRYHFLANVIAVGAAMLILRGAIPFVLEGIERMSVERTSPAEQEEPCDSAA